MPETSVFTVKLHTSRSWNDKRADSRDLSASVDASRAWGRGPDLRTTREHTMLGCFGSPDPIGGKPGLPGLLRADAHGSVCRT